MEKNSKESPVKYSEHHKQRLLRLLHLWETHRYFFEALVGFMEKELQALDLEIAVNPQGNGSKK